MRWKKSKGCGGLPIYELVDDDNLYAVVQRDGDWSVYLPAERRLLAEFLRTLREAKLAAERYFETLTITEGERDGAALRNMGINAMLPRK